MSAGFVESFGTAEPEALRLGGKGAALARLVQLGHRVPPGFVLTAQAFDHTLEQLGLAPAVADIERALASGGEPFDTAEHLRTTLLGGRIPTGLWAEIEGQADHHGLFDRDADGLIVRSSATVEDSAAHSFAGIFESIPITKREELEPTILEVWASVFTPRAVSYVKESGLTEVPRMAIVIQRFLDAVRSGVMFTRFAGPEGHQMILVEHVEGGCEKLVKGAVTPDRLWLEPREDVPDDLGGLLLPVHARELARLAGDLETVFGSPQDVEWVVHDDAVHLVQSRPITVGMAAPTAKTHIPAGAAPILTGVAASPGAGSGEVHLAFNIEQALDLSPGQVLVTPMTNPDMVVSMRNSAAIVTDVGGMICHAAIVSRELGLPCVVGTEQATVVLSSGQTVTVDGSGGSVYEGELRLEPAGGTATPAEWPHLWGLWVEATADRPDLVPIVPTAAALEAMPGGIGTAVVVVDLDLRSDPVGLWNALELLPADARARILDDHVGRLSGATSDSGLARLFVHSQGSLDRQELAGAVDRAGDPRVRLHDPDDPDAPRLAPGVAAAWPTGPAAVPLGSAALVRAGAAAVDVRPRVAPVEDAVRAGHKTERFFGHRPGVRTTGMPSKAWRSRWWTYLGEYGRFHAEHQDTYDETGTFEWWDVRPELVISAMLKSLVQPGFEMVPRVMGFTDLPPLYLKWIRCRYHFRSDVFERIWAAIVDATWDEAFMADLMRRVRWSYRNLAQVLPLFPATDEQARAMTPDRMVAAVTSWWPRWVELFALSWFIQAQGDDVLAPFIEETVTDHLGRLGPPPDGLAWPGLTDFILPSTPVMSGDYMASVGRLRELLRSKDLTTTEGALDALDAGDAPDLQAALEEHLAAWHWMRDRDLLFEPWDTPARVIATALKTEPHAASPYGENLRRNLVGLGFHHDLAATAGRSGALAHAARFLHDLNVERENHHVLWLKFSYPLRRVLLEVERRFVDLGSLQPGDVFFVEMPELLDAVADLPAPMPEDLVARVANRRRGFRIEARLDPEDSPLAADEDDYL